MEGILKLQKWNSKVIEKKKLTKQWRVVARRNRETFHSWQPEPDCPTGTDAKALHRLRLLVEAGDWIMAQRKVDKFEFELVAMKAGQ